MLSDLQTFHGGGVLKKTALVAAVLLAVGITATAEKRVIYGDDNRVEVYESSAFWQRKAASTVALVNTSRLSQQSDGTIAIKGNNYGSSYNLCEDEPFREQQSSAFCSGSLVGHNLVLTAGHCLRTQSACNRTNFVFGFGYSHSGKDVTTAQPIDVYSCKSIVAWKEKSNGADYAVVELDRSVIGREVLSVNRGQVASPGDRMVIIGHPAGIPTKVADDAYVREVKSEHFVANIDAFGGNSGSAVFNERTGLIEGILVRGWTDFTYSNGCRKSYVCKNDGCSGEDVTRVDQALDFIPTM